ncbi:MAG: hypothetical protein IJT98_08325 [Prevotella sp.]|nr:hypothetical protein [Prevotella sp.]
MTHEEEYLRQKIGSKNPFTVPEGYFEQLTSQVMQSLPGQKQVRKATIKSLRPWLYAAACVCVAAFTTAMLLGGGNGQGTAQQQTAATEQTQDYTIYYSDNYIEAEADYAMVDNQEIYSCLLADM